MNPVITMNLVTKSCCVCSQQINNDFRRFLCALCDNITHTKCIPESFSDEQIISYNHPQSAIKFICHICKLFLERRDHLEHLDATIRELSNRLSCVKENYKELQLKHDEAASHLAAIDLTASRANRDRAHEIALANKKFAKRPIIINHKGASTHRISRSYREGKEKPILAQMHNHRPLSHLEKNQTNWKFRRKSKEPFKLKTCQTERESPLAILISFQTDLSHSTINNGQSIHYGNFGATRGRA